MGIFKNLKATYERYKEYVRVDLLMYGVMILMVIIYIIVTLVTS